MMKPASTSSCGDAGVEREPRHMPHLHRFLRHHRQRRDDERRNAQQPRSPLPGGEEHDQAARRSPPCPSTPARNWPRSCRHPCAASSGAPMSRRSISRLTISLTLGWLRRASGSSRPGMSIAISSMMRPGRRLITSTRSDSVTASSRSWVISSAVLPARLSVCASSRLQHHPGLRVDRRERLVEQQHRRVDRERPRQRHALPHAARQLMRVVAGEFRQLEVLQQRLRAPLALIATPRPGFRRRTSRSRRPSATAAAGPSAA